MENSKTVWVDTRIRQQLCVVQYLSQKEDKIAHSVNGGHSESIFHQDDESITGRGAETGAVDGCRSVSILKPFDTLNKYLRFCIPCTLYFLHKYKITYLI